ncbi:MAG: hypothetical protein RIR26_1207 [Pseudomonadota bacterium]|jgi:hypothetical protein
MQLKFLFLLSAILVPAGASANDHFQCIFNLKKGAQTQAFRLKQNLTVERTQLNYPIPEGRNVQVTEGILPFVVEMGWDRFTAKITYRYALEAGRAGTAPRAAQWKCFEASVETIDGLEEFSCGDKQRTDDPFADPNLRWRSVPVANNTPDGDAGPAFQESFVVGAHTLSLECSLIASGSPQSGK